jgi:xanthine/uracil/vitamin C permease (AzgA family)
VNRQAIAGITTFLTMSYIVVVHPAILSTAGMRIVSEHVH